MAVPVATATEVSGYIQRPLTAEETWTVDWLADLVGAAILEEPGVPAAWADSWPARVRLLAAEKIGRLFDNPTGVEADTQGAASTRWGNAVQLTARERALIARAAGRFGVHSVPLVTTWDVAD